MSIAVSFSLKRLGLNQLLCFYGDVGVSHAHIAMETLSVVVDFSVAVCVTVCV